MFKVVGTNITSDFSCPKYGQEHTNFTKWMKLAWLSPDFVLTNTSKGLVRFGLVASQYPSESILLIAVGGNIDTLHWPRGHFLDISSLQLVCT